jgi:DNA modification methylase
MNKLILGDNLEILQSLESETVDLVYLDPPFFSNRNYEVIWGDDGEIRSFQDRWSGGIDHYIAWLKERVIELHRILKSTGSIFLHCDWHADAYIRVYILDKVFGEKNFRNHIIWCYSGGGYPKLDFGNKHDSIFRYSKSDKRIFNADDIRIPYNLDIKKYKSPKSWGSHKGTNKIYKPNDKGKIPEDWWIISPLNSQAKERIGYPTQKPEKLLERIILCASNENDVILDPFVGGGTTVAVADRLKRQWLGIDQSVQAIKVSEIRLQKQQDLFSKPFITKLHKYDYDTLRYKNAFEFETWIVQQFDGYPNTKQRGDKGIDGKTRDGVPIQVKRSDNVGRNVIDNFISASKRFDNFLYCNAQKKHKTVGYIIAFSFGKGAIQEVARLKNEDDIILELITVESIIPIAKKPKLIVDYKDLGVIHKGKQILREIEFIAQGESKAGIEFYAWDWNYNAENGFKAHIMLDKKGQQKYKFKTGSYTIAVKVVDNEGLENIEITKLKINGKVR